MEGYGMKRLFVFLFAFFVLSINSNLAAQDSTSVAKKSPQAIISFAQTLHDFGSVQEDTTLSYRFSFRNSGNDTLRIYRLKSG